MAKKRIGTCEIKWCKAKKNPVIYVNENIGDVAYLVNICKDCARILGLKEFNDLPSPQSVQKKLKAARSQRK